MPNSLTIILLSILHGIGASDTGRRENSVDLFWEFGPASRYHVLSDGAVISCFPFFY